MDPGADSAVRTRPEERPPSRVATGDRDDTPLVGVGQVQDDAEPADDIDPGNLAADLRTQGLPVISGERMPDERLEAPPTATEPRKKNEPVRRPTAAGDRVTTMPGIWERLRARRRAAVIRREEQEEQMSPEERRFIDEGVEGNQADEFVTEHLGGINPNRLLGDDEPRRD